MKSLLILAIIALASFTAAFAEAAQVVTPAVSCTNQAAQFITSGSLSSQAFTFPTELSARSSVFYFDGDSPVGNDTGQVTIIISASERSATQSSPPAFDADWLRWVNLSVYTNAWDSGNPGTLTIDWANQTWSQTITNARFGILSATWGGANLIPSTAGYRYVSLHIQDGTGLGMRFEVSNGCASYNGYLRFTPALNYTDRILRGSAFLDVGAAPPSAPTLSNAGSLYLSNALSWTAVSGALGYNLTRVSPSGTALTYVLGASPLTYTDVVTDKGMWRYNVTAWHEGGQATSSDVFINATYPPLADTLIGDLPTQSAALFGSASDDAQKATKFFFGTLLLIAIAGPLAMLFGPLAGGLAGLATVTFLAITGWWPAWVLVLIAAGIAAFVLYMTRGGNTA